MSKIKAYGICLYKQENDKISILLCKSARSNRKWGFLKGVQESNEDNETTALREFEEESSIKVLYNNLEKYFEQENKEKDIGIYLVNYAKIYKINDFFINNKLINKFLSRENSNVEFFDIDYLPIIKKKQMKLTKSIVNYLKEDI